MSMKRFLHGNATSMGDAVEALSEASYPLAGGTDLIAMMKEGLVSPDRLVNLKSIPGFDIIDEKPDSWHVGALMTLSEMAADSTIAENPSLACLRDAILASASPQLRHMATIGGNLLQRPRCWYFRNRHVPCWRKGGQRCFAFRGENKYHTILGSGPCYAVHPSDPAVALMALEASVLVMGPRDRRTLPLSDFYHPPTRDAQRQNGYHPVTVLAPNELVAEIIIPKPPDGARSTYIKMTERGSWDFALVSTAVSMVLSGEWVQKVRVALGGVATVPWRARAVETMLEGEALTEDLVERAVAASVAGARALEHNEYKIELTKSALRQALHAWLP